MPPIDLLVGALFAPMTLLRLNEAEWDLLIRQGRNADLLARIAAICTAHGLMEQIPVQPRLHLESASNLALRQQRELYWEVEQIVEALAPTGVPVVLLKGAAYAMAALPAAEGRMVSDVDILVPREALVAVESALMMKGWVSEVKSAYDQPYYRDARIASHAAYSARDRDRRASRNPADFGTVASKFHETAGGGSSPGFRRQDQGAGTGGHALAQRHPSVS